MDNKLILTPLVSQKLKHYVDFAPGEVSGIGKTIYNTETKEIVMNDIIIFEQTCSAAHTELDEDAMLKYMYEVQKRGESLKEWDVWWHSHASMGVFWSTTDNATIRDHMDISTHLISLVTNKAGDYKARLDIFPEDKSPFGARLYNTEDLAVEIQIDPVLEAEVSAAITEMEEIIEEAKKEIVNLRAKMLGPVDEFVKEECKKEIAKKLTVPKPVNTTPHYSNLLGRQGSTLPIIYPGRKKKGKNYYDGRNERQTDFEDVLGEIENNGKVLPYNNDDGITTGPDGVIYCLQCQNPIGLCSCHGHNMDSVDSVEALNEYLAKTNRKIFGDDEIERQIDEELNKLNKW